MGPRNLFLAIANDLFKSQSPILSRPSNVLIEGPNLSRVHETVIDRLRECILGAGKCQGSEPLGVQIESARCDHECHNNTLKATP